MEKNNAVLKFKITAIFLCAAVICFFNRVDSIRAQNFPLPLLHFQAEKQSEEKIKKSDYVDGEILVKYKKNKINLQQKSGRSKADSFDKNRGLKKILEIENLNTRLLKTDQPAQNIIDEIKNDPEVEIAELNYKRYPSAVPNDEYFPDLWGLHNTGQTINSIAGTSDADIDAPEAWDAESPSSPEITVAIIDSGVDYDHPDLAANMWDGSSCKDENNIPISGGCPNHGWNYEGNNNDPNDADGHGSMIAGIIGANTDNSSGISGMSFYNKIRIIALKFDFTIASELKAISFAKNNGAKVINASFSGAGFSQIEKDAIESFSGIFVAAASNDGANNEIIHQYPSDYENKNIISVTSSDQNDNLSSFSNYGSFSVDITAPGENIVSTDNDSYAIGDGTSFAASYVSGIAALLYSRNSDLSIRQIRYILLNSGDDLKTDAEIQKINSGKRANLQNSLEMAESPPEIPDYTNVYRFWSDSKQHHFYTASEDEKDYVIATWPNIWNYEGIAYRASGETGTALVPVYRFWSDTKQGHFFTASEEEKDYIIATYPTAVWNYEGIAFYASNIRKPDMEPVYRFWSNTKQGHFFTASEEEKDFIIANYDDNVWLYEGIALYVPMN